MLVIKIIKPVLSMFKILLLLLKIEVHMTSPKNLKVRFAGFIRFLFHAVSKNITICQICKVLFVHVFLNRQKHQIHVLLFLHVFLNRQKQQFSIPAKLRKINLTILGIETAH